VLPGRRAGAEHGAKPLVRAARGEDRTVDELVNVGQAVPNLRLELAQLPLVKACQCTPLALLLCKSHAV
jgi:hypothetical protein